ncbi:MAG: hypothetical protein WA655_06065 [Candidatus Korobacteraceae bacterium]
MKKLFCTTICLLLASAIGLAQAKADRDTYRIQQQARVRIAGGYQCGSDPILLTDGSSTQDYVGASPNYYLVHLQAGHSYSAEMWDPLDLYIGGGAQLVLLSSPGCTTIATTDFASADPNLSNDFADRISWRQSANADAVLQVNNLDTTGSFYTYVIRVTDTTLQNNYWTTASGLGTEFVFSNNTQQTLSGKLLVKDVTAGGVNYTVTITVPSGQQVIEIVASSAGLASPGLQVPANHIGRATFGFTGPPGGIMAEAYTVTTANVPISYIKFEPKFSPR